MKEALKKANQAKEKLLKRMKAYRALMIQQRKEAALREIFE